MKTTRCVSPPPPPPRLIPYNIVSVYYIIYLLNAHIIQVCYLRRYPNLRLDRTESVENRPEITKTPPRPIRYRPLHASFAPLADTSSAAVQTRIPRWIRRVPLCVRLGIGYKYIPGLPVLRSIMYVMRGRDDHHPPPWPFRGHNRERKRRYSRTIATYVILLWYYCTRGYYTIGLWYYIIIHIMYSACTMRAVYIS